MLRALLLPLVPLVLHLLPWRKGDATSSQGETFIKGRCQYSGCFVYERDIIVRDGRYVNTKPSMNAVASRCRPCQRGVNTALMAYHPNRLKYPMTQVEGTERGAGQRERITWDAALSLFVEKIQGIMDEYGPNSILKASSSGSNGMIGGFRLFKYAHLMQWCDLDICVDAAHDCGSNRVYGSGSFKPANQQWEEDFFNSKTIVVWGNNTSESYIQG